MIPVHLKFSGLYSYQKAQSIDFEKLTASQLFGIFGPVGSGKSTILEAIMFVLYDRSDRLNKSGDNRYYNMLNLQSSKLEIDFIFRTKIQSEKKYRAYFSAQRKKKDFEKVEVKERGQYEWKDGQWIPREESDASSLLGMTYEHFMQTVIIPQGKFREFIDQRPNVRTQMLKDLFQLHRFDLGAKTGSLLRKTELLITDLEARLLEIGLVSEEDIVTQQAALAETEAAVLKNQKSAAKLEEACLKLDALKKLLDKISDTEQELNQLQKQSTFYDEKEKQLKAYMKAETFFNEKFRLLEETIMEYRHQVEEVETLEGRLEKGKEKVQQAKITLEKCKNEYQQRERFRQQSQDLHHLLQINQITPKWQQANHQQSVVHQQITKLESLCTDLNKELMLAEQQLDDTEKQQQQWQIIKEVDLWLQRYQELTQECERNKSQIITQEKEIKQLNERKESILNSFGWPGSSDEKTLTHEFTDFQRQLHQEQDTLQKEISELRVKEKLAQVASQLKPGAPCLLCGSTEHPQIAHSPSVKQALEGKQEALGELRQKEKAFRELEQAIQKIVAQAHTTLYSLQQIREKQNQLQSKIEEHQQRHRWPEYKAVKASDIEKKLNAFREEQKKIDQLRHAQKQYKAKLNEHQEELKGLHQNEQKYLQAVSGYQAALEQQQSMVKELKLEDFAGVSTTQLQEMLAKKQQKLKAVEQEYEEARQVFQEYQNALEILQGRKEVASENRDKLALKADTLNDEIQSLSIDKEFGSISEIKELISLELDTDTEQEAIVTYRNHLHNAEVTLHKLQSEVKGRTYNKDDHEQLQNQWQALTLEIQQQHQKSALQRQRIIDWQEKRARGQEINTELGQQRVREANLKELVSLFRGSGFVNYASTVLLENLCRVANQRFMRLTQNSLSLELSNENEFIVRDYLNDGRTRLLKTLSGGQTFQASLCLALALAENVKALNQADQSFFFLDEGFGSLDRESLRVVFDTLKSLRKENRIVGIISHVEELQHEIDVFLKIEKDRQKGSMIRASWE
uniref:SMC family ATPase n=1 Tax=Roseihalotalea indica TaxID=2867963 RepID=A0AA49GM49_9BACT|nr:SMC family ATPase [Tunicatimonas sp. TK19036]